MVIERQNKVGKARQNVERHTEKKNDDRRRQKGTDRVKERNVIHIKIIRIFYGIIDFFS